LAETSCKGTKKNGINGLFLTNIGTNSPNYYYI
jgi:hypothetical protein